MVTIRKKIAMITIAATKTTMRFCRRFFAIVIIVVNVEILMSMIVKGDRITFQAQHELRKTQVWGLAMVVFMRIAVICCSRLRRWR